MVSDAQSAPQRNRSGVKAAVRRIIPVLGQILLVVVVIAIADLVLFVAMRSFVGGVALVVAAVAGWMIVRHRRSLPGRPG